MSDDKVEAGALAAPTPPDTAVDARAERGLLRKLDLAICPPLFVVYTMSFLDRINIGNARIQGMADDLQLYGNRFNVALIVFFISYMALEVPFNMLIRRTRPSLYLASLMFAWGVVDMCMGFVGSYGALVALRFLLGVLEAGVLPGFIYVTSVYYKRHEYQRRLYFFASTVIAYAIGRLGSAHGVAAWRWIFIIEGAVTCGLALVAADGGDAYRMDSLTGFALALVARDWKIWLGALVYLSVGVAGYSAAFLPTILVEFDWRAKEAQVCTISVYAFASALMLLAAWASDRLRHRLAFILAGAGLTLAGYGMLLAQAGHSRGYKFAAVFLVLGGAYVGTPMALGWLQNNLSGHWKRSLGSAVQVTVGNLAGIVDSVIFLERERPDFATGYGVAASMTAADAGAAVAMAVLMRRENVKRAAEVRDNLGDWHPSFRFTL